MVDDAKMVGLRDERSLGESTEPANRRRRRQRSVEDVDIRVVTRRVVLQRNREERQLFTHTSANKSARSAIPTFYVYVLLYLILCFFEQIKINTIRYDTIVEFNVDSKAEYSALSSTRRQKKKLKQTTPVPL